MDITGPKCLPLSKPYLAVISTFFFGFLLATIKEPISVPITYFVGPASVLYSKTVAPINGSLGLDPSVTFKDSIGPSLSFLVSHQSTLPSVEVVTHSVPVLLNNH